MHGKMSALDPAATSLACRAAVVSWPDATIDRTCLSRIFDRCAKAAGNLRQQHGFPLALDVATAALLIISAEREHHHLYFATEFWRSIKKLNPGPSGEDADAGRPTYDVGSAIPRQRALGSADTGA